MAESTNTQSAADKPAEQKTPAKAAKVNPALNADGTHVWLRNPDTEGVWACPVDAVDYHLERGWQHTDAPADDDQTRLYDTPDA